MVEEILKQLLGCFVKDAINELPHSLITIQVIPGNSKLSFQSLLTAFIVYRITRIVFVLYIQLVDLSIAQLH